MVKTLRISGCRLYDDAGGTSTDLLLRDGAIAWIGPAGTAPAEPVDAVLEADGRTLIPGLIDVHIHGAGGGDVLDGDPAALSSMSRSLARLGTTSFVGTTFMQPDRGSSHVRVAAEQVGRDLGGARLLGLHLEGPFINPDKRGGITARAIWPITDSAFDEVIDLAGDTLRIMTIAPELEHAPRTIERLVERGTIASFGHSLADHAQTREGIAAGIRHATHLYNAMTGLHHREPGPLVALYDAEEVSLEIISDDVHVDRRMVRWTHQVFGADRMICITDSLRTLGLPDGRYEYGGRAFESRDGACRLLDGTLIGTSISLLEVARRYSAYTGCPFAAAVDAASLHPARRLGIDDRKGSIEVGKDADLVLLEPDGAVHATLVGGAVVHAAEAARQVTPHGVATS